MVVINITVLIVGNKVGHTAIQGQSVIIRVFKSNVMNVISSANLIVDDPDAHEDVGSRRHLVDKSSCQNSNLYDCRSMLTTWIEDMEVVLRSLTPARLRGPGNDHIELVYIQ